MFGKEKKAYSAPAIGKIQLDDEDVNAVVGGVRPITSSKDSHTAPTPSDDTGGGAGGDPAGNPADAIISTPVTNGDLAGTGCAGNGDVGRGRGRGGGCDGVPYHRMARTFSSGRNSGC